MLCGFLAALVVFTLVLRVWVGLIGALRPTGGGYGWRHGLMNLRRRLKATLVQTWEFVKRHALRPDGLISFHGVSDVAKLEGVTPQGFRKLRLLGFLTFDRHTQGGSRAYYTINPNHPPVERLTEDVR